MTYDSEFGSHVTLYKNRIKQVIDEALKEHPNTMIIRVDLHDPIDTENLDNPFFQPRIDSGAISRFTSALKAKLEHHKHFKTKGKTGRIIDTPPYVTHGSGNIPQMGSDITI